MTRPRLLIVEGPDGVGKSTLVRHINGLTPGSRVRSYGRPDEWTRSWRDAWGIDLVEDLQRTNHIIHDRGMLGHGVWSKLWSDRLLVYPQDLGPMLDEVEERVALRVVILVRDLGGMTAELRERGEETESPARSVPEYWALFRTLLRLGVDVEMTTLPLAQQREVASWWR